MLGAQTGAFGAAGEALTAGALSGAGAAGAGAGSLYAGLGGEQGAMLGAQTGEFGAIGETLTADALGTTTLLQDAALLADDMGIGIEDAFKLVDSGEGSIIGGLADSYLGYEAANQQNEAYKEMIEKAKTPWEPEAAQKENILNQAQQVYDNSLQQAPRQSSILENMFSQGAGDYNPYLEELSKPQAAYKDVFGVSVPTSNAPNYLSSQGGPF